MLTGYRFDILLDSAPAQHRAVSLIWRWIYVSLVYACHHHGSRSGFSGDFSFCIPEAKIQAYWRKKMCQSACACNQPALFLVPGSSARCMAETLSRDITAQQRYTGCSIGDFSEPSSLATMIRGAWCSALHLEPRKAMAGPFFRWTPSRKPASSDARPSSDDTPLSGGCSDTGRLQTKSR